MDYRIVQKGMRYKLQERRFILWHDIKDKTFFDLDRAIKALYNRRNWYAKPKQVKWKEVYRIWNGG